MTTTTDPSAASSPRFFGVLVTFRRLDELETTFDRLASQTRQLSRLIVVDNGADNSVADLIGRYQGRAAKEITYVSPGDNTGPAGGFAIGMERLVGGSEDDDWIFLFDDDDPPYFDDTVERASRFAVEMAARDPDVGGVGISGGRFDLRTGRVIRIGDADLDGPTVVDHVTGGGLPAYRVGAVRHVGLPTADLFFGFEELEYGLRMTDAGHTLYADGDVWLTRRATKREAGLLPPEDTSVRAANRTSVRLAEPTWRRYYSLRNLIYLLRDRDLGWTAFKVSLLRGILKPLANLPLAPGMSARYLSMNLRALRDGWLGRLGRTVEPG